jgi:hypothetical protein
MNIDNSGATFVFDEKSTQAIEEAKNRLTLLAVEELRLKKLVSGLTSEIVKLEGEMAYKQSEVDAKMATVATLEEKVATLTETVADLEDKADSFQAVYEEKHAFLEEKENAAIDKQRELELWEEELTRKADALLEDTQLYESNAAELQEKTHKLHKILNEL